MAVMRAVLRPSDRIVECTSIRWRLQSAVWLALPRIVRRGILGVLRRLCKENNL